MIKQPNLEQKIEAKKLLQFCINKLIINDSDIFNIELIEPPQISEDAKILNRELHETTINHRLAYYIENYIQSTNLNFYKVDIEYNRRYEYPKNLDGIDGSVRPDILVHTRMVDNVEHQHYLVIEAKKGQITTHNKKKVKNFITDSRYNYLFGLTISYCSDDNHILADLYYFDGENIIFESINFSKNV